MEETTDIIDIDDELEVDDDGDFVEKKVPKTGTLERNPNGANMYIRDPRQEVCWRLYIKGLITGRPNGFQAALDAGYSHNTALNINTIKWFKDKKARIKRRDMLTKAERNLDATLDLNYTLTDDQGNVISIDKDLLKIVVDVSKTIATTLGKAEGYSTKTEVEENHTGEIIIKSVNYNLEEPVQIENQDVPIIDGNQPTTQIPS